MNTIRNFASRAIDFASSVIPFRKSDDNIISKYNYPKDSGDQEMKIDDSSNIALQTNKKRPRRTSSPTKIPHGISAGKPRNKPNIIDPKEKIRKYCESDFQKFYEANRFFDESNGKFTYDPNGLSNTTIVTFFQFMNEHPDLGIKILLWLDTFHDFKSSRIKYTSTLNSILNTYLNQRGIKYKEYYSLFIDNADNIRVEKLKYGKKEFSILSIYRDAFFDFPESQDEWDNCPKHPDGSIIFPLSKNCENTFIKECYAHDQDRKNLSLDPKTNIIHECAMIMYDLSVLFINTKDFEFTLLYSYIIYNFIINNQDITFYKSKYPDQRVIGNEFLVRQMYYMVHDTIEKDLISAYAKDVGDMDSIKYKIEGDIYVLPSSLFDANKTNSSTNLKNYINVPETKIPLCYKEEYTYKFQKTDYYFNLQLQSGKSVIANINNKTKDTFQNFSKVSKQHIDATFLVPQTSKLYKLSEEENNEFKNQLYNYLILLIDGNLIINHNIPSIEIKKNLIGLSVPNILTQLVNFIINKGETTTTNEFKTFLHSDNLLQNLEMLLSLKRLGDFGQIIQCKQLGIPLHTKDNMQLLISLATCTKAVWSPHEKLLFYDVDENGKDGFFIDPKRFNEIKKIIEDEENQTLDIGNLNISTKHLLLRTNSDYINKVNDKIFKDKIQIFPNDLINAATPKDKITNLENLPSIFLSLTEYDHNITELETGKRRIKKIIKMCQKTNIGSSQDIKDFRFLIEWHGLSSLSKKYKTNWYSYKDSKIDCNWYTKDEEYDEDMKKIYTFFNTNKDSIFDLCPEYVDNKHINEEFIKPEEQKEKKKTEKQKQKKEIKEQEKEEEKRKQKEEKQKQKEIDDLNKEIQSYSSNKSLFEEILRKDIANIYFILLKKINNTLTFEYLETKYIEHLLLAKSNFDNINKGCGENSSDINDIIIVQDRNNYSIKNKCKEEKPLLIYKLNQDSIIPLEFDTIKTIIVNEITRNKSFTESFTESIQNIFNNVINLNSYKVFIKENYDDPVKKLIKELNDKYTKMMVEKEVNATEIMDTSQNESQNGSENESEMEEEMEDEEEMEEKIVDLEEKQQEQTEFYNRINFDYRNRNMQDTYQRKHARKQYDVDYNTIRPTNLSYKFTDSNLNDTLNDQIDYSEEKMDESEEKTKDVNEQFLDMIRNYISQGYNKKDLFGNNIPNKKNPRKNAILQIRLEIQTFITNNKVKYCNFRDTCEQHEKIEALFEEVKKPNSSQSIKRRPRILHKRSSRSRTLSRSRLSSRSRSSSRSKSRTPLRKKFTKIKKPESRRTGAHGPLKRLIKKFRQNKI
jgi:hypothetical protein